MAMIMNTLLTGREDMRDAALLQWHYALGTNTLDKCFVTGFGTRPVLHPHHRRLRRPNPGPDCRRP